MYTFIKMTSFKLISNHSIESAIVSVIYSWLKAVNNGKLTGCVMVDFRKAFDLVDHKIMLNKLKCYKCNETCLSWFESYLSSRTQCVSLNNTLSKPASITCGVPQGSILGPFTIFNLYNRLAASTPKFCRC